jgi:hypothetical protein
MIQRQRKRMKKCVLLCFVLNALFRGCGGGFSWSLDVLNEGLEINLLQFFDIIFRTYLKLVASLFAGELVNTLPRFFNWTRGVDSGGFDWTEPEKIRSFPLH